MKKIITSAQIKYIEGLVRTADDTLLNEMEEYALKFQIPILNWFAAKFLEQLVLIKKPKNVLEIGTAIAYSTIRIARKLQTGSTIDTLERSKDNIKLALPYIKRSGVKSKINLIEGDAHLLIPNLKKKYNFIFLDADKQDYETLFNLALPALKKNGVIFVDNLLWHGYAAARRTPRKYRNSVKFIRRFNKVFTDCKDLETSIYPIGDGIGVGIKK